MRKMSYEEPQLIDLEEEVGCQSFCATGGDSGPAPAPAPTPQQP